MGYGSKKILEERQTAFDGMKKTMEKIERLSVEERSDFDARNRRITELDADLRTALEAEKLAEAMRQDTQLPEAPSLLSIEERAERDFSEYLHTGRQPQHFAYRGSTSGTMGAGTFSAGTLQPNYPAIPANTAGYLVPPGWWQRLQVALKVYGGVSNDFEQLETATGQPLVWTTVDPTTVIGSNIAENASTTSAGTAVGLIGYAFGQGQLSAWTYTSGIQLVSLQLAQDSAFDLDNFVQARVGESLGRAVAATALTGSGSSGYPLGIQTALFAAGSVNGTVSSSTTTAAIVNPSSANGGFLQLGVAQTVTMGGTTQTEVAANTLNVNTLRAMIASVDPAYRAMGAKFYFNDAQLLGLRGQTDANGRPLVNLQDGVTPGVPTSIWGYEVVVDNNIANLAVNAQTTTAGTQGPIFGHLQNAMVLRKVRDMTVMRLTERYADTMEVGYLGFMRWDSRSNDLRAAVSVRAQGA
jgi:HK97 family phage major capsid protein